MKLYYAILRIVCSTLKAINQSSCKDTTRRCERSFFASTSYNQIAGALVDGSTYLRKGVKSFEPLTAEDFILGTAKPELHEFIAARK